MSRHINDDPSPTPFLRRIRSEAKRRDVVLVVVPLLLIAVFSLPVETRRTFVFDYRNPTLITAFTANYVHLSVSHLVSNLLACAVFLSVAYLLALSNGVRDQFYLELFVVLSVFPVLLSYLNLAIPRAAVGYGFSGLNMALLGYIAVEFTRYTGNYYLDSMGVEDAVFWFLVLTTFVSVMYAETYRIALVVTAVSGVCALSYLVFADWSLREVYLAFVRSFALQGYSELAVFTVLIVVGYVAISVGNPVVEAGIANVYVHFIAFCLGFINSYAFIHVYHRP